MKNINISTGHTVTVERIKPDDLPFTLPDSIADYDTFWSVKNEGTNRVFMYLGKGYPTAKRQIVAWYPQTGSMWHGYGDTIKAAIEGAAKDGWLYA